MVIQEDLLLQDVADHPGFKLELSALGPTFADLDGLELTQESPHFLTGLKKT